jgi:long-chain acyl-CoA synthetase
VAEFFHACDMLILEGYGLTESSAATVVNTPEDYAFGSVGKALPGSEIRIADDGEVLLHGRGVMRGYWNLPEDTAEELDAEGWLHTGDIGMKLPTGHLVITDRKKELIVTAGGKNIAPAHFQNLLKVRCPYVSQVLMHGDRRAFCVALVAISEPEVAKWAADKGLTWRGYADLAAKPEVVALIQQAVDEVNRELPSYETVKRIALLPEDLTVENGAITPSLKVKRRVVEDRYRVLLDGLFAHAEPERG